MRKKKSDSFSTPIFKEVEPGCIFTYTGISLPMDSLRALSVVWWVLTGVMPPALGRMH